MGIPYHKSLALLIGIGSLLFLIAAFLPISKVYTESEPAMKLEYIHQMHKMWNMQQILFIMGSILAATGLYLQVIGMKNSAFWIIGHLLIQTLGHNYKMSDKKTFVIKVKWNKVKFLTNK